MMLTRRIMAATFVALITASAVHAQRDAEAVQEERAVGFVKALQTGKSDQLLKYMHENWVPAQDEVDRTSRWGPFSERIIGEHADVDIRGVTVDRAGELTVLAKDSDGTPLRFTFEFEADPPHRIATMRLEGGDEEARDDLPGLQIADGASRDEITAALNAWFEELAGQDLFSGTALVARSGKPIFEGAWGMATKRWSVPNNPETRFDLGSINKSFTKIAIGQLLEQGKLKLDGVIGDYLPDYPNAEVARKVTLRQLLDHSGGLGDIFTEEFFKSDKAQYRQPADFFWLFAEKKPEFEPGTRQSYSNAGFMVLGAIIAAVSGESYDQYVARHIFEPAGMSHAGFFAHDEPVANVAEGYTRQGPDGEEEAWRSNVLMLPVKGNSAGSAQATALDLLHFDNALREYRLLSPAYTEWYFGGPEPQSGVASGAPTGRAKAATGIAGGAPGVSAALEGDGDLTVIVLSNYDPPVTEQVAQALRRALRDAP